METEAKLGMELRKTWLHLEPRVQVPHELTDVDDVFLVNSSERTGYDIPYAIMMP
jgi:hypothetical protein